MTNSLEDDIQRIVDNMDNDEQQSQEQKPPQPEETIHIHYFPDAIVILKEGEETPQVVDSTPILSQKSSVLPAYMICLLYLFLICSTLAFQLYLILNPPIATVTIIPKSRTVILTGTVQLGRVLPPLTISQSQTVPTTGKGHQDAKAATGFITFYNGQFQSVTLAAGLILTGSDSVQIITDQDVTIPPGNPSTGYGHITVSAHAINPGSKGNIPAYDINAACCVTSILAANPYSFRGGQDERDFQTVMKNDIYTTAATLKPDFIQSMQGALQEQLKQSEQLSLLPCNPTVSSDHQPGDEAIQVQVTVSETCSAVAYNSQGLETKATVLLTAQALKKLGSGYSVFGEIRVSVQQASVTSTSPPLVFLSFKATGTWVYGLSATAQERIKELIAWKTKDQAVQMVASQPGVERASISFAGFGDDTKLPKNRNAIHVVLIIQNGYS